ncbi:corticotropin-releasing factor-binding protein [Musca vetustissima]|uniref:corticotropin-releasing factor-binding protein n=1 Tax=Musca vetustissima TaxID=27455 RepID=UPI002AB6697A|nr:corticotropin-releasing factor-binding protein [Musca vetustissima]
MKAVVVFFSLSIIVLSVTAWPSVIKRTFDLYPPNPSPYELHTITDCMHVASEPGDYAFKKLPPRPATAATAALFGNTDDTAAILQLEESLQVCGLYVIGEPDTIVEITMKYYDVNCETGALMAFVDGWELNGEYFPSLRDHHRSLEDRVQEFCNNYKQWPRLSGKKFFRSSQNAALLQYRIPVKGSFIANVRFHKITQPCNILVQDIDALYTIANYGHNRNCTISALFPAVVSVANLKIGGKAVRQDKPNYDCGMFADRLEVGGSSGLDSTGMEKSSEICGLATEPGPEQAIFCGVTTLRLVSTGRFQNQAAVMIRKADEHDLDKATLICAL